MPRPWPWAWRSYIGTVVFDIAESVGKLTMVNILDIISTSFENRE